MVLAALVQHPPSLAPGGEAEPALQEQEQGGLALGHQDKVLHQALHHELEVRGSHHNNLVRVRGSRTLATDAWDLEGCRGWEAEEHIRRSTLEADLEVLSRRAPQSLWRFRSVHKETAQGHSGFAGQAHSKGTSVDRRAGAGAGAEVD